MPEYKFEKKTVAPGWCELHIVMERRDTPDYRLSGNTARDAIGEFAFALVRGVLHYAGWLILEDAVVEFERSVLQKEQDPASTNKA